MFGEIFATRSFIGLDRKNSFFENSWNCEFVKWRIREIVLWKSLRITEKHGAEGKPCGNNIFRAGNPRDFLVNNHFQVVDQFGQMDIVGILSACNDGFDLKIKTN